MSHGEIAFLALVLTGFASFIGIVGFLSIWTRQPAKSAKADSSVVELRASQQSFKRVA